MRINPSHLEQICAPSLDRQRFTPGGAWTVLFILGGLAALRSVQPFDTCSYASVVGHPKRGNQTFWESARIGNRYRGAE
jgi:hypothetical protein